MKRVIVGLSGGVDSSVAAYLLKKSGYEVIGVFMQNWDPYLNGDKAFNADENTVCESEKDFEIAKNVANKLEIPIYKVNFIKEYWTQVFEPFLDSYKNGVTPNPDILCNKFIKFGSFHEYCTNKFNPDYIATGHYAKNGYDNNRKCHLLLEAKDDFKDQTYFLCSLNQKQLEKSLFPLGDYSKQEIRTIAKEIGLDNWNKKDSTGICFIGKRNFKDFMQSYIENKPGDIIDINSKKILGKHDGIHLYTIGQRRGINLSGNKTKYFVCEKDHINNVLYVTSIDDEELYLMSNKAICTNFNWISYIPDIKDVEVRFRHTQKKINCKFELLENNNVLLLYDSKSKAVTKGQHAVLYQNGICLGGGVINKIFI